MSKKLIKVHLNEKKTIKLELEKGEVLKNIRKELINDVPFPFIFLDDEDNEISQEEERVKTLKDILDGNNLNLKKKVIENRKILGNKIKSKDKLDYYLYPQFKLNTEQEERSTNILVIGETGVGKSTWIHALLNYTQGIQIEENIRYLMFDQNELIKRYEKKIGKKFGEKREGSSVTDEPDIYNIIPNEYSPYENPIRIIDTAGFGDTRGKEYDEKIMDDIKKMFESSNIDSLNAVCILFKGSETRNHERTKDILDKVFSLFGKEIKNNIIIIFTFSNSSTDARTAITTLKDKSSAFYQIMGDIDNLPHFFFNNIAYFSEERENYYIPFEQNTLSFSKLFNCIRILKRISLESTRQVCRDRKQIRGSISNLSERLNNIIANTALSLKEHKHLLDKQKELNNINFEDVNDKIVETHEYEEMVEKTVYCSSGWYVLYCDSHGYVCHKNCRGKNEGWNSNEYGCDMIYTISGDCAYCGHHWDSHTFRTSYVTKVPEKKTRTETKYIKNPEKQKRNEDKAEIQKQLLEDIGKNKSDLAKYNEMVYNELMNGINTLYQLAIKNNELNEIALQTDEENVKYGFARRLLTQDTKIKKDNKVYSFFMDSLNDIEDICSNDDSKERKVTDFQRKLLTEEVE